MIISHEHQFIFIKTEKTAGTSIEIALSKYCGPTDIITPVSSNDESLRASLGYPGPQNHYVPARFWNLRQWRKACFRLRRPTFHSHSDARTIRRFVGDAVWNNYFKFCFERNPWDKAISWYYWTFRDKADRPSLEDFIQSSTLNKIKGLELYTLGNEIAVDTVYQFETLSAAMADIAHKIGLSETPTLPLAKATLRGDKRNYREILSDEARELIASRFQQEIAILGYEW